MSALPTKRDEAWRYADFDAVERLWPAAPTHAIVLAPGETVSRAEIFEGGIHDFAITLNAGAAMRFDLVNLGTDYGRVAIEVTLNEGADFTLNAVQIAGGEATIELITTVRHIGPGGTSRQRVRSVLGGRSTGTYLGKVAVARGAQQTDSEQAVRAMLLDRTATANAKPELEIYADDVKCAHGCAVGELDAAGLFYLQARGLPPAEAKRLMLQAFVAEVLDAESPLAEAALAKLGELV